MHGERHLSHAFLHLRGTAAGADLVGRTRRVFIGIIIEARLRDDLHGGERPVPEDRHRELPAVHILLNQHIVIIGEDAADRRRELLLFLHDHDADRRTPCRRLDHTGGLPLRGNGRDLFLLHMLVRFPRRGIHALRCHQLLGDHFVHRHGGSEIAGPGVWNSHQVEGRLNSSVLSVQPVQRNKHHISLTAQLQHAAAEERRALPFARGTHRIEIRRLPVENNRS